MKILGIVGSKRKKGNTATLMQEALKAAEDLGVESEIIYLGDYEIKGCYGCEQCRETYTCVIKDDMEQLYPKIMEADGLITASPTYFYNVTADMKAFLERLYCYEVFDESDRSVWMAINEVLGGKFAATIAICEQHSEQDMGVTSEAMTLTLSSLGYRCVENLKVLDLYELNAAKLSSQALVNAYNTGQKLAKTLLLKENIKKKLMKSDH